MILVKTARLAATLLMYFYIASVAAAYGIAFWHRYWIDS